MALSTALNTARSAKDLFFPQVENLMGFKVTGKQIELIELRDETAPFVLFGVRACDWRSRPTPIIRHGARTARS